MSAQEKKSPAEHAWENRIIVAKSPDTPVYAKSNRAPSRLRLKLLSQKKNGITDGEKWLAARGMGDPTRQPLPSWAPRELQGSPTVGYIPADEPTGRVSVALYGKNFSEPRYAVQLGEANPEAMLGPCLDFGDWQRGGRVTPVVYVHGLFREVFVSTAINGYAREVGGKTGYLSLLNWISGKLIWHAGPRVANAQNFALLENVVICGYGFTGEPDALYVLDVFTGKTLQTIPLASAPELIVPKDKKVYVRCYNRDYVFGVV
jgi:hypothetical protein